MDKKDRERDEASSSGIDGAWLFRSLAENGDWCLFVLDAAGRCVTVNDACCRWLKREGKEIVDRVVADFWPFAGTRDETENEQVRQGQRIDTEEQGVRDGRLYRLYVRKAPVRDDAGGVRAVLCLFREIAVEVEETTAQRPDAVVYAPSSSAKSILIVDPNVEVLLTLTRLLSLHGFHIRAVREGRQAVNFYRGHQEEIHLVVLDQHLPGKTGMETRDELWNINPRLPVILGSGAGRPESLDQPDTLRFRFLNKPYVPELLTKCVNEMLAATLGKEE